MDYTKLANELIAIQELMLRVPARQKISKLSVGSLFVLNYLAYHKNNVHPKELSEKMAVSTARIARLLSYLENKNMVQRYMDPHDNRQIIVELTELGRNEIQRVRADAIPVISDMLEKLGPEDAEAYLRIQWKIVRNYDID